MKKTIETITQDGGVWMEKNQNYIIKFVGDSNDKANPERSIYVHNITKGEMPWKVGMEVEYEPATKKDGSLWSAGTADKKFTFQVVKEIKTAQSKGFGGGGGNRAKTVEELKNDLPSYVGRYVTDLMSHRITLGKGNTAESIADDFDILAKRIHKTLKGLFDL